MREKILRFAARLACRHCYGVIGVAVLLTAVAIAVMLGQGYSSSFNVARMLPQNIPAARAFTKSLTDFGTVDEAIVVFWLNPEDPRAVSTVGKIAEQIVAQLQTHRDFNNVFCKLLTDDEKNQLLYVELPQHGMLLLNATDLERIKEKLQPANIEKSVANTMRKLATIDAETEAGKNLLLNTLGLAEIFQYRFEELFGKKAEKNTASAAGEITSADFARDAESEKTAAKKTNYGYLVSPNGAMLLLIAQPKFAAQSVPFSRRIMEFIENTTYDVLCGAQPLTVEENPAWEKFFAQLLTNSALQPLYRALPEAVRKLLLTPMPQSPLEREDRLRVIVQGLNTALRSGALGVGDEIANTSFDKSLMRKARALIAGRNALNKITKGEIAANNGVAVPPATLRNFNVEFGGGYQIARCYAERVNSIMLGTLILSAILVLAFFGYCFRRVGVLIYIGVPLLMIISWTGGIGWLLFGQLNLISCAFAAILVGLGIDYAVHIYNRYIEERGQGADIEAAFTAAICHTGWGVIVGMLTTCCAFLALLASRFQHLAEFGALGAIGIFLSAPTMMIVMPALITARNRWRPEGLRIFKPSEFLLPWVVTLVQNRQRTIFITAILCALLALGFIIFSGQLNFNSSMATLRPRDRAFEINGEITRAFSTRNPNKLNFIVYGESEEAALEKLAQYEDKLKTLQEKSLILAYESLTRFLPPPSQQRQLLAQMSTLDLPRAEKTLQAIIDREGYDAEYFAFNLRLLRQHAELVATGKIILPSDFKGSKIARLLNTYIARQQKELHLGDALPENLKFPLTLAKPAATSETDRLMYPAGATLTRAEVENLIPADPAEIDKVRTLVYYDDGYAVKVSVYPPVPPESRDGEPNLTAEWLEEVRALLILEPAQFAAAESDFDFTATLTGVPIASMVLAKIVKEDFLRISICIAVICFGTIYLLYGNLWRTLYCFLPVGLGLLYLFGFMAVLNTLGNLIGVGEVLNLNFVNVLTIPIIIGVGVDNGIHLVQRYFESGRELKPMIVDTGRALAITALTSMVGFGSLIWAKFQGLDSIAQLGILSTLALLMVLLASLLVFPAIIATLSPKRK